jgi:hypothetical protein
MNVALIAAIGLAAALSCAGAEGRKMLCALTNTVVDSCCCVEREGKMHCTLADKDVDACCCKPVADDAPARTS